MKLAVMLPHRSRGSRHVGGCRAPRIIVTATINLAGRPLGTKRPIEGKRIKRGPLSMLIRPTAKTPSTSGPTDNARSEAAEGLAVAVGKEVRSLRLSLNMAANALASSAGLSNGMLSKIERGTATPSFATLSALSKALNVPVARFFAGTGQTADYSLVRAGRGILVQRRGSRSGIQYQLLGHLLSGEKYVEPYLVEISDTAANSPSFQHTGIEFMYILSGSMIYRYADDLVEVHPGDTLVFDANALHGHERVLQGPVKLLSVVFNLRG